MTYDKTVRYEDFGAVGDGVADDMEAICRAHEFANAKCLPVQSRPDAEHYIGPKPLCAVIETDTDWGTSRFIIDDRAVENNHNPCFTVRSALQPCTVPIQKLKRDQKKLDFCPDRPCYVRVTNSEVKKFIRFGLNQNNGSAQTDCFILEKEGTIATTIDWDYEKVTDVVAHPIDSDTLTIRGGIFTTIANQAESVYNYYSRNIHISRSGTVVDGLTHYITGEGIQGAPYQGFVSAGDCANIEIKNCFFTGHKIYETIGSANLPVMMGSYDLGAGSVVNYTLRNCKMNHITDRTRWGVIGTNFCKNILVEDCVLSRLDAHMGVSGSYTVRNSELGWQGLNAIGRGTLSLEGVTLHGDSFLGLRGDYGSTWEGDVKITDCKWILHDNAREPSFFIAMRNNGMHDFGYTSYMPENIEIDNVCIEDSALPDGHRLYLFSDPCAQDESSDMPAPKERPYPYVLSKKVICKNLRSSSGRPIHISPNEELFQSVAIKTES